MAGICTVTHFIRNPLQSFRTNIFQDSYTCILQQVRGKKHLNFPRLRQPIWFAKKERAHYDEQLTPENKAFIRDVIHEQYGPPAIIAGVNTYQQSPLKNEPMEKGTWSPESRRTGVVARKIGVHPMWLKNGTRVLTTLLHVVDNHVIRYIPPEEFDPPRKNPKHPRIKRRLGCLIVGAESTDPQKFTKEYCGLFTESGVVPKKKLARFMVSADAAVQPGTPLYASHFRVGDYVDVRGFTIDRGFQGVVTRWGFKGGPASHGVTKTHRRPGNIGSGGEKARVWPGQKMPGHMGNRSRILKGLKILRINTKYNVIWVQGPNVAGATNSFVHVYDTLLSTRNFRESPYFPTYYPEDFEEPLPDEMFSDDLHPFSAPTITFNENV